MKFYEDPDLSPAAARLSFVAREDWDQFKMAFAKYAARKQIEMLAAELNELPRSQGRAQACNTLAHLFEDAVGAANDIAARRTQKRKT